MPQEMDTGDTFGSGRLEDLRKTREIDSESPSLTLLRTCGQFLALDAEQRQY
jgi:hypothetical protein